MNQRFEAMNQRFEHADSAINQRFERMGSKLDTIITLPRQLDSRDWRSHARSERILYSQIRTYCGGSKKQTHLGGAH
jgi:hypothetical protein